MSINKKHLYIVAFVSIVIILLLVIIFAIYHHNKKSESFVPGDFGRYYISNDGTRKSSTRILSELMHNAQSLYVQISSGSYPNFATIYGVFNNYKIAMEKHSKDRLESVDDLVDDMLRYLAVKSNVFNDPSTDEWRLLERKLINMNNTLENIKKNAVLIDPKLADELNTPLSGKSPIRDHFESALGRDPRDEYNLADTVIDSLSNTNSSSQIDYGEILSYDTELTQKSYQDHIDIIKAKRNRTYYNAQGKKILPNIQTKIITESIDGTIKHDPMGYRGDPRVYSNNPEAAKEVAYNPDVIESVYQPSMRVVQVS
jgi:hypothetical protein